MLISIKGSLVNTLIRPGLETSKKSYEYSRTDSIRGGVSGIYNVHKCTGRLFSLIDIFKYLEGFAWLLV